MSGVAIGSETDPPTLENRNGGEGRVFTRFPCPPDTQGSMLNINITASLLEPIATMTTVSTNQAVQSFLDCLDGIAGFDQNPDLDHRAGLPVVRRGGETRRDHDAGAVLVKNEAVQRTPPLITVNRTLRPDSSFGRPGTRYPMNAENSTTRPSRVQQSAFNGPTRAERPNDRRAERNAKVFAASRMSSERTERKPAQE
jgi:hypothetical protein